MSCYSGSYMAISMSYSSNCVPKICAFQYLQVLQNVQKGRMSTQKCELSCTLDVTVFELIAIVGALTQFLFHSQISTIPNLLQKFNVLGGFI